MLTAMVVGSSLTAYIQLDRICVRDGGESYKNKKWCLFLIKRTSLLFSSYKKVSTNVVKITKFNEVINF